MERLVSVAGAAAVMDFLLPVRKLPAYGGFSFIEEYRASAYPGGCAPNIAVGLQALCGCRPQLIYPVGSDAETPGIVAAWEKAGLDCEAVSVVADVPSGRSWLFSEAGGGTMCFAYPGAADVAVPGHIGTLGRWVVLAPMLNQFTRPVLDEAVAQNRKIVLTGLFSEELSRYAPHISVLICNHHEADTLCGQFGVADDAALSRAMPHALLYVTAGTNGSILYQNGQAHETPVIPADCLCDVTGAGDAFSAGVVFGLMRGFLPEDAAYAGACCSSFVVEQVGAQTNVPGWLRVKGRLAARARADVAKRMEEYQ